MLRELFLSSFCNRSNELIQYFNNVLYINKIYKFDH